MNTSEVFHRGERALQTQLGVRDKLSQLGERVVRGYLLDQYRAFFEQLPLVFYGAVDNGGQPWASVLIGTPGFASSPDPLTLSLQAQPLKGDPVYSSLAPGSDIGLLGLDFATRRRNRVNGRVKNIDDEKFQLDVHQSFGNCPKYIQLRHLTGTEHNVETQSTRFDRFEDHHRKQISSADTFFIATQFSESDDDKDDDVNQGVDVSHRGGNPGFILFEDNRTLVWPDFTGNRHFNTLGNLHLNPRAGLMFIDFERGDVLFVAGTARTIWDGPIVTGFDGAERMVRFEASQIIEVPHALPYRWSQAERSPFLKDTGVWAAQPQAKRRAR